MRQTLARAAWNFSEWSGLGLGRFAPWVLGVMLGSPQFRKLPEESEETP